MNTNILALVSTAALLSVGTASAMVTFSAPTYGGDQTPIDGVDGWTQSEPNPAGSPPAPMFFVQEQGGNSYGYLSGYYAVPDTPPFSVSRYFARPAHSLVDSTLSFNAAIVDSVDFPERNNFGMTVSVGAVDLLTITLTPESQTVPSNWAINHLFNGESSMTASGFAAMSTSTTPSGGASLVTYEIDFTPTGLDVAIGAQTGPTASFSGTPTSYNPASTDGITVSFFWAQGSGANFGDNGLLIDDIEVVTVPEPASACLVLLGIAGIALRRRR